MDAPRRTSGGQQDVAAASAARVPGSVPVRGRKERQSRFGKCADQGSVKRADQFCARRNPSATTRRSFVAPPFERGSLLLPHFGD